MPGKREKSPSTAESSNGFLHKVKMFFSRKKSNDANQKLHETNEDYNQQVEKKYKHCSRKRKLKNKSPQCKLQMEPNNFKMKRDTCFKVTNLYRKMQKEKSLQILKQDAIEAITKRKDLSECNITLKKLEETLLITELLENKIKRELNEELINFSCHLESIFNAKFEIFLKSHQQQRENRKRDREERAQHIKKSETSKDYTEKIINEVIKRLINDSSLYQIEANKANTKPEKQLNCDTVLILSILPKASDINQIQRGSFFENLRKKSSQCPPKTKYEDKEITVILPPRSLTKTESEVNIGPSIKQAQTSDKLGHGKCSITQDLDGKVEKTHEENLVSQVSEYSEDFEKQPTLKNSRSSHWKSINEESPASLQIDESYLKPLPSLNEYCCQTWSRNEKLSNSNRKDTTDRNYIHNENVKFRFDHDKLKKDSGIDYSRPKSEICRNKSTKNQNFIKPIAEQNKEITSRCHSQIEDNIQKQFDGISKTIDVIQHLYYETKPSAETSSILFNKHENQHFPGIYKTIENLKDSVNNIRKPGKEQNEKVEVGTSHQPNRRKLRVSSAGLTRNAVVGSNVVQQITETSNRKTSTKSFNEVNKTSLKKEACHYPAKPQTATSQRLSATPQESFLKTKIENPLKLNDCQKISLRNTITNICFGQNLMEAKISNEVLQDITKNIGLKEDHSLISAFERRKQYDCKLRKKVYKISNKRNVNNTKPENHFERLNLIKTY